MSCNCIKPVDVMFFSELDADKNPIQDMKYAKEGDACVDIRCKHDVLIKPYTFEKIATGLFVAVPVGYELQARPRSGLSAKTSLIFKNTIGTIDSGYRDEIFVLWYNLGPNEERFKAGERIAQVKVERVLPVNFIAINSLQELKAIGNDRGGGFGHTGSI